ncbi:MAG: carbamoyltransferase HypF [Candidatus Omnitrophica bacterium]|nr:carbamoyltransferase HypF [Candidatus Omnitrophota bacterium]
MNLIRRFRILIKGKVQGVGFRPTVYRYAKELNLTGFVCNTGNGVLIEVEGEKNKIALFLNKIKKKPPQKSEIKDIEIKRIEVKKDDDFKIIKSKEEGKEVEISPDIATCKKCLKEVFNPQDRRYLFPFINCTDCGPRFTIIKKIPYDRKNTTMNEFIMCDECKYEYQDIFSRRFHAQPNCCFTCGPEVRLINSDGKELAKGVESIKKTAKFIEDGKIVAIKGIGGYHIACNAENKKSVEILRERKKRYDKPFALMARNVEIIKKYCFLNKEEEKVVKSWQTPIVLLRKKNKLLPYQIAPENNYFGFFLPYTPIHHLIFHFGGNLNVLIMTSGNFSEEPIIYEDEIAFKRLKDICDYFLTHNRKIYINCDDSVLRIFNKNIYFIRRSRGFVPEPIEIPYNSKNIILAAGADLKNTFAFVKNNKVILSQHIGDLENQISIESYKKSINLFKNILEIEPEIIVYDMHPNYFSSRIVKELFPKAERIEVQHHHSHILSCMADNFCKNEKVIGVAFDGTGYGIDGNIWGGEFLICDYKDFERVAHLKYMPLQGGEISIKEVWRIGVIYLYKIFGDSFLNLDIDFVKKIDIEKWEIIKKAVDNNINVYLNSSIGRLFDAVSAILNIRHKISYEGQAAIELEMKIKEEKKKSPYNYKVKKENNVYIIEPEMVINGIIDDLKNKKRMDVISYRFHITVSEIIKDICKILRDERNINKVALSGGVFQNIFLLNDTLRKLKREKFKVLIHRKVPTNDGGISLGQATYMGGRGSEWDLF